MQLLAGVASLRRLMAWPPRPAFRQRRHDARAGQSAPDAALFAAAEEAVVGRAELSASQLHFQQTYGRHGRYAVDALKMTAMKSMGRGERAAMRGRAERSARRHAYRRLLLVSLL